MTTWCRKGHNLDLPDAVSSIWSTRDQRYKNHCRVCKRENGAEYQRRLRAGIASKCHEPKESYAKQVPEDMSWTAKALCDVGNSDLFFNPVKFHEAAKLCKECPVRRICLEVTLNEPYGFSGGMTPDQRQSLINKRKKNGIENYTPPMPETNFRRPPPEPVPYARLDVEKREEIIRVYGEGNGLRRTAQLCASSRSTVYRVVKSAGVMRTEECRRMPTSITSQDRLQFEEMALKLFKEGLNNREISSLVNRAPNTVQKLRRHFIQEGRLTRDDKHSSSSQ